MELKPYKLAPETEEALAVLGEIHDAPYKIFGMAKLADMQFSPIQDRNGNTLANSFALYEGKYMFSPDTHIRRTAFDSFTNTLQTYKNTIAAIYETEVKNRSACQGCADMNPSPICFFSRKASRSKCTATSLM